MKKRNISPYAIDLFESGRGEQLLRHLWIRIHLIKQSGYKIPKGRIKSVSQHLNEGR